MCSKFNTMSIKGSAWAVRRLSPNHSDNGLRIDPLNGDDVVSEGPNSPSAMRLLYELAPIGVPLHRCCSIMMLRKK